MNIEVLRLRRSPLNDNSEQKLGLLALDLASTTLIITWAANPLALYLSTMGSLTTLAATKALEKPRQGAANAESSEGLTEDQTPSQNVNVLVTSGTLIPSLVKCLLFQLDGFITRENVYSSWDVGKLQCFLWIKKRFEGPGVQFCAIGDSMEECQAAENLGWPFVKIDPVLEGGHRFPGLSLSTVKHYLHCIYGSSESDEER